MQTYLTIPGDRGIFRTGSIDSVSVYVPRAPFTDEVTGIECTAVLFVETRRCLHRFSFATHAEACAVVAAAGLVLSCDAPSGSFVSGASGADPHPHPHPRRRRFEIGLNNGGDEIATLPPLPTSRRRAEAAS